MFGSGFQRLESALVAREKNQGSLTSNIANADTPNFKADSRTFADFMADEQSRSSSGAVAATHHMHFSDVSSNRLSGSVFSQHESQRMDGNTVDMQKEMARLSENQLMHEMAMRLVKGRLSGLMNAIKEGNR
ncbi:MAG: flagellar basal body rod protein FlgB [Mariprofundus sp.]